MLIRLQSCLPPPCPSDKETLMSISQLKVTSSHLFADFAHSVHIHQKSDNL